MYATFDLNNAPLNFDCTLDPQDDFDGFLNDDVGVTELATSPAPQANRSQDKLQKSNHASTEPDLAHDGATQARKQRALEKSREAQKRFRHRQKARLDAVQAQLDATTKQLRELRVQQQQLQTRNVLLEKIAQLSKEQTSEEYLVWQNKQAVLDFSCAHTQQTPEGFTLTLTIFGHAEKRECRTVSNMSVPELAALWSEYMRKLAKCLLALQHDHHGGARPLLDLWVAEAIALICCVRVYNPEFLKVIDSSAMDGSQNTRLSNPLLVQHMELLELSHDQIRDGLYIRRIAAARAAELELQRREASAQMLPKSSGRQHPSDHLANARAVAEKLRVIGVEEYKLHGIVTDALFNGVFTSVQDAMGLVHMYPFLPDAMEYLDCIASLQGLPEAQQEPVTQADWDVLLAYCAKVTAADHFHYVSVLHTTRHSAQATSAAAVTPSHSMAPANQTPSPIQRSVHFSPDSVLGQPSYPVNSSQGHSYSGSHSLEYMTPPAYCQSPPPQPWLQSESSQALPSLGESQMVQSLELARQESRQGSNQLILNQISDTVPAWLPQGQASQHMFSARQDEISGQLSSYSQHQLPGLLQAAQQFPNQGMASHRLGLDPSHNHVVTSPAMSPRSFWHVQPQQSQFVQGLVSQAPVQTTYPSSAVRGFVSQGMTHQGQDVQLPGPDHLPAWLGQNLAYTHATTPSVHSGPNGQMQSSRQMQHTSHLSPGPNPKAVYPTAAMRSQQITSAQTHLAHSTSRVQAPLAPFLNEQLKRILAEGGPSGRRGF